MTPVRKSLVVLPGDGIGPEVISAATATLKACAAEFGHQFVLEEFPFGGAAIESSGVPLPRETLDLCRSADAILLGAVGGPRWDSLALGRRPEAGLLALRKELELYVNLRPITLLDALQDISPLKPARAKNLDFEIVRELAGGIYFGDHRLEQENGSERAWDIESYSAEEIERVTRFAFARAANRSGRLTSVDKANVLASSALWRKTVTRISPEYPNVTVDHMYVDSAAMQLVLAPGQFDTLVTSNLFGDILSDAGAALVGSIGLVSSMSRGVGPPLFEPIHGSAPSLAGKDIACPIGSILCVSLMLREAFGLATEAEWIEAAVDRVLKHGYRTADIAQPGCQVVGCKRFSDLVCQEMRTSLEHQERYGWGV